jgi:EAL domain-containing protein (putative c-di-GMP-specific phosphodiesterase class I)
MGLKSTNLYTRTLIEPFYINGQEVFATASVGAALSTAAYRSAESMLADADLAMHKAKQLGKANSQVFDSEMRASAVVRWELEKDLRHALDRDELKVHYQPKVAINTGETVGFEALLRWEHPARGVISPLQFISIAEETGLIVHIGSWILRSACRQIKEWNDRFRRKLAPLSVSVNVSCCQFSDISLFERIAIALSEARLEPQLLSVEITESNLMGNTQFAAEVLNRLKAMGVGLMIDDFGTGYSSLSHLAQFPFDALKIDQSFVRAMRKGNEGTEIVKTMLALASNLGMEVVAEGIETPDQRRQLDALGCPYGQGFLFSKPLSVRETERALSVSLLS